ncbi:universal stress protein [Microbacterium immunditiarum]|uniref:universal stress protein n=1 Tax=Microbacterium immunditiarum TaxID=337480 RepID=UPI0031B5A4AC
MLTGPAARTLIELSKSCGMLVLGSRGLGGFAGMLLGSVSAACVEHAHCPVFVVRPRRGLNGSAGRRGVERRRYPRPERNLSAVQRPGRRLRTVAPPSSRRASPSITTAIVGAA